MPRHVGSSKVPWGCFPNSLVLGNFQENLNIPHSDSRREFGKFPHFYRREIPQISRHLGSSQVPWGNSPNSSLEGNFPLFFRNFGVKIIFPKWYFPLFNIFSVLCYPITFQLLSRNKLKWATIFFQKLRNMINVRVYGL